VTDTAATSAATLHVTISLIAVQSDVSLLTFDLAD